VGKPGGSLIDCQSSAEVVNSTIRGPGSTPLGDVSKNKRKGKELEGRRGETGFLLRSLFWFQQRGKKARKRESNERKRKRKGKMGCRLQNRRNWGVRRAKLKMGGVILFLC